MMFFLRRAVTLVSLFVLFQACSGVPLKTLLYFHSLTPADIQLINPSEARAALLVDSEVHMEERVPTIDVSLERKDGKKCDINMTLEIVKEGDTIPNVTPNAPAGQHWYLLALTADGQAALLKLQSELRERLQEYSGMFYSVQLPEGLIPEELAKHCFIELQLQMASGKGFMTLYKGYCDLKVNE